MSSSCLRPPELIFMTTPSLFPEDPGIPEETPAPRPRVSGGTPRLRPVERCQGEIRFASLDQLLPPDHGARVVWAYVEGVDIEPLLQWKRTPISFASAIRQSTLLPFLNT